MLSREICKILAFLCVLTAVTTEELEDITFTDTAKVIRDISALYLNQKFSDVIFSIDDQRLYAHKMILAGRSEYFEALLYNPNGPSEPVINMKGVSHGAFRKILEFIYTGTITLPSSDEDLVTEVNFLAHKYSFKELESSVLKQLINVNAPVRLLKDVNLATPAYKAKVISGQNRSILLSGNREAYKYTSHQIGDEEGITVELGATYFINHIRMRLCDLYIYLLRYSYYVEVSEDQKKWKKVIDYSKYPCGSVQDLYFEKEAVRYIRVVGTKDYDNTHDGFRLVFFETDFASEVPETVNGIVRPTSNVATFAKNAFVTHCSYPYKLIDGIYDDYRQYTQHPLNSEYFIKLVLPQPYAVSTMQLRLWDEDVDRYYKYYIETSIGGNDWKMVADRRNESCRSWQHIEFEERPVVYVKINGTYNSNNINHSNEYFHVLHFECPAESTDRDAEISKIIA